MKSAWEANNGKLACCWGEFERRAPYNRSGMDETPQISCYVEPVPDFASHSPFGGADWFLPHWRSTNQAVDTLRRG